MMKKLIAALLAAIIAMCAGLTALADEMSVEERLSALEARVAELEQRVSELEDRQGDGTGDAWSDDFDESENSVDWNSDESILQYIDGSEDFMVVELTPENFKSYFDFAAIYREAIHDTFTNEIEQYYTDCNFINLVAPQGWYVFRTSENFAVEIHAKFTNGDEYDLDFSDIPEFSRIVYDSMIVQDFDVTRTQGFVVFARGNRVEISDYESGPNEEILEGIVPIMVTVWVGSAGYGHSEYTYAQ